VYIFAELSFFKHRTTMNFNSIAAQYREACANVEQAIKASKYKITWFMEQLGLGRSAFYGRLSTANWQPEHLEKIALLLEGKEVI
jgi:hypothetical protein